MRAAAWPSMASTSMKVEEMALAFSNLIALLSNLETLQSILAISTSARPATRLDLQPSPAEPSISKALSLHLRPNPSTEMPGLRPPSSGSQQGIPIISRVPPPLYSAAPGDITATLPTLQEALQPPDKVMAAAGVPRRTVRKRHG